MIWWTSDWHLLHKNILKHCNRPFDTVEEMGQSIIHVTNKHVKQNDELYILGDVCWKSDQFGFFRKQLNVRNIHVVMGNHDKPSIAKFVSSVDNQVYKRFGTVKIFMSHYPSVSWRGHAHGSIHLYGHSHGRFEDRLNEYFPRRKSMDVGIDLEWRPFSFDEIVKRFK